MTTDEQKHGVADYFAPTAASKSTSGSGSILGGTAMSTEGTRVSSSSPPTVVIELAPPWQRNPAEEDEEVKEGQAAGEGEAQQLAEEELLQQMAEREQEEFENAEQALRDAIQDSPGLADMAQNLVIDNTPEGLRIQLVDQEKASMFPSGGAKMNEKYEENSGKSGRYRPPHAQSDRHLGAYGFRAISRPE